MPISGRFWAPSLTYSSIINLARIIFSCSKSVIMKFTLALATALLCADAGLAAKLTAARQARHASRRAAGTRRSLPKIPSEGVHAQELIASGNESNVEYSSNWAGAVLIGSGYKTVTGTFTVPTPSGEGAASAWVGIDGDTAQNSILQTGLDFYSENGAVSFDAWYEWYADDFSGISFSVGDQVTVTVTATSTSAGTAVIQNLSTGKSVTHSFSGESNKLQELNAEWIVEDFEENGSLVEFANFGTVTFTNAVATTSSGTSVQAGSNPSILDIEQNNKVLTSVTASGSTVTIKYV
ncbi:acid proteinase [Xylaria venustula]|nr:acid proteinase [Xylaria venustula]